MFIKTLTIQGFKSYRDQTQIEPFSPKHNVVVGRNGSGKSNFFAAIRFVLSDAYTSMSREERQSLLHEGISTQPTISAYVEIIFDNTSNRFPTGRDEVILRRTIGLKKDEYSLDKKSANKADVMNLLESAGFSKSNPYYIVPQGRITSLTNAKDHERLALLKEVAGTKVYEQRRAESLRIMTETDAKRTKIGELLDYIESRLTELEEEKEELREFQEKDRERRCVEYALYQRELDDAGAALEEIEEEHRADVHGSNVRSEQFNSRVKEIARLKTYISETEHSLEQVNLARSDAQTELTELASSRAELECTVADLRNAASRAGGQRAALTNALTKLEEQIRDKQQALTALTPRWEAARTTEATERRALEAAKTRLDALMAKQGRGARFRNANERDAYLRPEIESVKKFGRSQEDELARTRKELEVAKRSASEVAAKIGGIRGKMEESKEKERTLGEEIADMKEQHAEMVERRKEMWREDAKLTSSLNHAAEEMKAAERNLAGMMDKDTGTGLRAVDKIAERFNLEGVYGPLYRLFQVADQSFNIAVELTAGNSLFHVVVDNDDTASKVLDVMLKEKTGRVTFMPLNRLKPKNPPVPSAQDAIPLLSKLTYDPAHQKAFQQVFGKTCVCRDLTIAAAYVKSHGINTITLDGDKVDRKGALTGGYHDVRRSRIEAIKAATTWRQKHANEDARAKELKAALLRLDQEITRSTGEIQKRGAQQVQARESRDALQKEGYTLGSEQDRLRGRILKLEGDIEQLESEISALQTKVQGYEAELSSPFVKGLTDEEQGTMDELGKTVDARQKQLAELSKAKNELGGQKSMLEIELKENLSRRYDETQAKLERLGETDSAEAGGADLSARNRELNSLSSSIDELVRKKQEMEEEADGLTAELQKARADLEKTQNLQAEDSRNVSRQQKNAERYHAKRAMLIGRKDECNRNIRDLGVLPEEAFEKYTNVKLEKLVKKLHTVNEGLKKFAHVNKKAFEQYGNFTKQRDQLIQRRTDLEKSAQSIEELVEVLDQRKDEAIERTFKQVASNFEEVFEKLVPAGRGRLIIQRRIDQEEEEEEEEDTQQSKIDNYTGVSIKVSFNSKVDEGLRIQQLSGGQKSLVALATVFAIQKCDPAPFYLFDEIDANLDAQYRTAVAAMIHSLSSSAQFITTTFRPEMLVSADQFYGVLFNNQKVSSIRTIKREEAMEFVDQEAQAH